MKESTVKTILSNHNLELEDFTKSIVGKTLQQYDNGETNYPFTFVQQFIINNINVNLSETETKKLIAHSLKTTINKLDIISQLMQDIEDFTYCHLGNAVEIKDSRRKLERILNRDYT